MVETQEKLNNNQIETYSIDESLIESLGLPSLPAGYGFAGGTARAIAQKMLFGEEAHIRDIDIVAFTDHSPDMALADELSAKYMPDDYAYGHGVGGASLEGYF